MSLARRLRVVSEKHLMTAAERSVARKYGANEPLPPKGIDLFWQKVYVPAYYLLPWKVRAQVMAQMPGSHRRTWHTPPQAKGPAV